MPEVETRCPTGPEMVAAADATLDTLHPFALLRLNDVEASELMWPDWVADTVDFDDETRELGAPKVLLMRHRTNPDWFLLLSNAQRSMYPMRHSTMGQWWRLGKNDMQPDMSCGTVETLFDSTNTRYPNFRMRRWLCNRFAGHPRAEAEMTLLQLAGEHLPVPRDPVEFYRDPRFAKKKQSPDPR